MSAVLEPAVDHAPITRPFLGLYYFDEEHENLFFGRDEQVRDILTKIGTTRFVAVMGTSGSGKSSLVRAGVIPALRRGFLTDSGAAWRIIKCRPGNAPIAGLAAQVESVLGVAGAETTLRRGPLGLVECAMQAGLGAKTNLLVMVDQFEEIFRYEREARNPEAAQIEAAAFVKLLLQSAAHTGVAIYVLLTARSEYLGACARFRDLPERINNGLYLVPPMRRDQLEEAITGPVVSAGARFSPALVQRLLNDAGEDPDQLPVLQHALLRTWLEWKKDTTAPAEIGIDHYTATGGVAEGLNRHADEIYRDLDPEGKRIAEVLFRALSERDPANNLIRHPTRLRTIAEMAKVSTDEVRRIANEFRDEDAAFLTPAHREPLNDDTYLDITHESLIRKWRRLGGGGEFRGWVQEEADLRDQYIVLVKAMRRAKSDEDVLVGGNLQDAQKWRDHALDEAWAERYERDPAALKLVREYIGRSEKAFRRSAERRRTYAIIGTAALIVIALLSYGLSKAFSLNEQLQETRSDATARLLASQAEGLRDRDHRIDARMLLAIESLREKPLPEGALAIREPLAVLAKPAWIARAPDGRGFSPSHVAEPAIAFSDSGKYVGVARDGSIHIYEAGSGAAVELPDFEGSVVSMAWAGDAVRFATVSDEDAEYHVYGLIPGTTQMQKLWRGKCDRCFITPDGRYVVMNRGSGSAIIALSDGRKQPLPDIFKRSGIDAAARGARLLFIQREETSGPVLYDLSARSEVTLGGERGRTRSEFRAFAFSADTKSLALSYSSQTIHVHELGPNANDPADLRLGAVATSLALSADGRLVAAGDDDGGVRVIDALSIRKLAAWAHGARVSAISFSSDGKSVASVDSAGEVRLVVVVDRPASILLDGAVGSSGAYEGNTRYIRTAGDVGLFDGRSGRRLDLVGTDAAAPLPSTPPSSVAVDPRGEFAAIGHRDGLVRVRALPEGEIATVPGTAAHPLAVVALSPRGAVVVVRWGDRVAALDARTGKTLFERKFGVGAVRGHFSRDGRLLVLASATTRAMVTVNAATWAVQHETRLTLQPSILQLSPDGAFLTVRDTTRVRRGQENDADKRFIVIDTAKAQEVRLQLPEKTAPRATQFSPNGRYLAAAVEPRQMLVFELPSLKLFRTISTDFDPTTISFSNASDKLVLGESATSPQVYRVADGKEVSRTDIPPTEHILAARFSDDDRALLVLSMSTVVGRGSKLNVTTHSLQPEELIVQACARAARNFTKDEWRRYFPDLEHRATCPNLPLPQ